MRRCSLPVCIALAAAIVVGGAAIPQAASAASGDDPITITSITNNAGSMIVTTQSGSPVTSLTVHLFSGSKPVKTVTGFTIQSSWDPGSSRETLQSDKLTLSPAAYSAKVDATDSGGTQNGINGGTFDFRILTAIGTPSPTGRPRRSPGR